MRVCFWSTTFQADNQALAYYLAEQPGTSVVVAMERPELYVQEAVQKLISFKGRFVDRTGSDVRKQIDAFGADLVVVDNHLPPFVAAPRMLVMWHGFGWRVDDMTSMRRELERHVGDVTRPTASFRWQAFGDWDRSYRIERSKIASENVVALGSAYSDWLIPESPLTRSFRRAPLQSHYTIDLSRPIVLLALTWHHGGSLGHWGDEETLLRRFFEQVEARGASTLVRMHDRHRYEQSYLDMLDRVVRGRQSVQLKFKSSAPDSLVDLLISDVMVSNYSSILNPFYYTGKPTVHIDPAVAEGKFQYYRQWRSGALRKRRIDNASDLWKLDPSEIGGLRASSFAMLSGALERALSEPSCCAGLARAFCDRYVTDADGRTCQRIAKLVKAAWF